MLEGKLRHELLEKLIEPGLRLNGNAHKIGYASCKIDSTVQTVKKIKFNSCSSITYVIKYSAPTKVAY